MNTASYCRRPSRVGLAVLSCVLCGWAGRSQAMPSPFAPSSAPESPATCEPARRVGQATEAGIWRAGALYRQTWVSGANPHRLELRVEVDVRFDGGATARRSFVVPSGERWAVNLDDVYGDVRGAQVNATVRVTCDRECAASVALWHGPIGKGEPTVYGVPFVCVEP